MAKDMLINTVEGQECRIAVVEDGVLEELYVERASSASRVGNIYKGRVTNIEPGIQAAFVDFGVGKSGFLHISDVSTEYFPKGKKRSEPVGRKRPHRDRPPIQECLHRGQEVVVQMTKEGIGTKGPTLTTYLSIPGRMLVMMPGMRRLGVSRKIEDEQARSSARKLLGELSLPEDMGFIIRTAGADSNPRELKRDLNFLLRLWKSVKKRIQQAKAPCEIHQESDLVTRTLRDVYTTDTRRIIADRPAVARRILEFLQVAMPRSKHTIEVYTGRQGLFHEAGIEREIETMYSRRVELPSGGSLVFDQTEALVAIDVNSGRFRKHADAETTALKLDLEAAGEIVRQLRLRDLGGVVVIDFVDLREEKNRKAVERKVRDLLKADRAKSRVLRMSSFGIVELTRQRVRPSLKDSIYSRCPTCDGAGLIRSEESQALRALRNLQRVCSRDEVAAVQLAVPPGVAHQLLNYQRDRIAQLEKDTGTAIVVRAATDLAANDAVLTCRNGRGSEVAWDDGGEARQSLPTVPLSEFEAREKATPARPEQGPAAPAGKGPAEETQPAAEQPAKKKSRRRGKRGGRKHRGKSAAEDEAAAKDETADAQKAAAEKETADKAAASSGAGQPQKAASRAAGDEGEGEAEPPGKKKPRRRGKRGGRKHRKSSGSGKTADAEAPQTRDWGAAESQADKDAKKPKAEPEAAADKEKTSSGSSRRRRKKETKPAAAS